MIALDIALLVLARGFKPVPIPIGAKAPVLKEWQLLDINNNNVALYFDGAALNVGAQMGPMSRGLTDVDLDCVEAVELAPYFLPRTGAIYGRASKKRSHYLYICGDPDPKASIRLNDENTKCVVELRLGGGNKGAQSVWPDLVHTSGELYEWDENSEPASATCANLKAAVVKIAVGTILVRGWPPLGGRHEVALGVGGFLARAGWPADDIAHFVTAVCRVAKSDDPEARGRDARDSADNFARGGDTRGLPWLRETFGSKVAKKIAQHIGYRGAPGEHLPDDDISLDDFYAYMPLHSYMFTPTRELWPAASINARLPTVPIPGTDKALKPSTWLDQEQSVEQMTWAPGMPMLIENRLISNGEWIESDGVACFNLYRPPTIELGDRDAAGPWLDHVRRVYPDDTDHIIMWFAHRRQRPEEKINHALFLGGGPGIGKDTILEPVKQAIGPWNFEEASPKQLLGRFNSFLGSVILRISEARDLGEVSRYEFHDATKTYTAAPPNVLRVDEKHLREYYVLNVVGIVITSNHKDALFLPPNDRRHYVAWSDLTKEDFDTDYWNKIWAWYEADGYRNVAAYLDSLDISKFNAKAPPKQTRAFWTVVGMNQPAEEGELLDVIDIMGNPNALTLKMIVTKAFVTSAVSLSEWLTDRKKRRAIPHRLEQCEYVAVRNDAAKDGLWKIDKCGK